MSANIRRVAISAMPLPSLQIARNAMIDRLGYLSALFVVCTLLLYLTILALVTFVLGVVFLVEAAL